MKDLAKYSFVNAKIRAMLSYLIEPALFLRAFEAKDFYDFIELFKATPYAENFRVADREKFKLQEIEKGLLLRDLAIHRKICDAFSSKHEKHFIFLLTQYYEIEELKTVLRIWHKKAQVDIEDYILDARVAFDIDFKRIAFAQSIEEIILFLDHTPYKNPLMLGREKFKERNSHFYLEAALDADYYRRLLEASAHFSRCDKKLAHKILGVEIDIENINWLIRMRKYYSLGLGQMLELLIPGGERVSKDSLRSLHTSDEVDKIAETISTGPYAKLKDLLETNIYFLEQFLYEVLFREIRKALAGFPFTIGIALGYLILKRRETRNVISLMYAKSLGIKREEAEHLINI